MVSMSLRRFRWIIRIIPWTFTRERYVFKFVGIKRFSAFVLIALTVFRDVYLHGSDIIGKSGKSAN